MWRRNAKKSGVKYLWCEWSVTNLHIHDVHGCESAQHTYGETRCQKERGEILDEVFHEILDSQQTLRTYNAPIFILALHHVHAAFPRAAHLVFEKLHSDPVRCVPTGMVNGGWCGAVAATHM